MFKKKKEKLKEDVSKFSEEEKEEVGLHVNKGLLIFCGIVLVLIIIIAIIISQIK